MAEVKIEKKKVSTPKHTVEHISVSRMGNGYHVTHRKMMPAGKGGPMPTPVDADKPMVFTKTKDARKHVNNLMDMMGMGLGTDSGDGGGQGGDGMPGGSVRPEANT